METALRPAFGTLLRRHRLAAGLTQEELAERVYISRRSVSDMERGVPHRPPPETVALLAAALGLAEPDHSTFVEAAGRLRASTSPAACTRSHPVPAVRATPPSADCVLVGRDDELDVVQRCLDSTLRGQGILLLISGEAGIGKTALALAAGRQARSLGAGFGIGRCYAGSSSPAFAAWHDLLADLRASTPLDLAALPQPFGDRPPAQTAYGLMQAVAGALHGAAMACPLVLLLDDLHWADPDTLELLGVVTRRVRSHPLAVIGTYRAEEIHPGHPLYEILPQLQRDRSIEHLRLAELTLDATAQLVEVGYGSCSPELAAYLHARSDGNPFFLIELLRDLAERRMLGHDGAGRLAPPAGAVDVPDLLQHVITQRVTRLGAEVEALLDVAAVMGNEWHLAVVEAVLGRPEESLLRALEAALDSRVIVPMDGRTEDYRFAHALIGEVLYGRQVARRRKHVHARIGAALEELGATGHDLPGHAAALARHFGAAEEWEKAARHGLMAGDTARDSSATRSALQHYGDALDLARKCRTADSGLLITLCDRLQQAHGVLNQYEQAESACREMLALARSIGDRRSEGFALVWLGLTQQRLHRMGEARTTAAAALQVAEQVGDIHLLGLAEWNLGHLHLIVGELEDGLRHSEMAERHARGSGDRDLLGLCLQNLSIIVIWRGRYAHGEALAGEARDLARAGRDASALGSVCFRLGLACIESGRYAPARQVLQAGLAHVHEVGDRHNQAKLLNTLGGVHDELGDTEAALRYHQQALEVARHASGSRVTEAECYALLNLAADELHAGRLDSAERRLREFEPLTGHSEYARFRYFNRYQLLRSEVALVRGEPEMALGWADEAHALAEAKGVPKNVLKSRLLRGRALFVLRRPHEAAGPLRQALAIADGLEHGALRWQVRLWLGRVCAALHQPDDAISLYRQAQAQVEAIAVGLDDERRRACFLASPLVQELQAAASAVTAWAEKPAYPAGLTGREIEVLRLVAQGATNAEIARALCISTKTVDVHLRNILGKTESANRAAAAAFASRHGLA